MSGLMNYLSQQYAYVGSLLVSHIRLSILSVAAAIVMGIPLGIFISDKVKVQKPVLGVANVIQAIPSLAILGFLRPLYGHRRKYRRLYGGTLLPSAHFKKYLCRPAEHQRRRY